MGRKTPARNKDRKRLDHFCRIGTEMVSTTPAGTERGHITPAQNSAGKGKDHLCKEEKKTRSVQQRKGTERAIPPL